MDTKKDKLDCFIKSSDIELERGKVISKDTMVKTPGHYPVYSSSVENNGLFGQYGLFMFNEELITWSVDGGGNFFYRPKHKFSVTNVSGILRVISNKFFYRYLFYLLDWEHKKYSFDYVEKAHPSVIRDLYDIYDIKFSEQRKIAEILSATDEAIEKTDWIIEKYKRIKQGLMQDLFRYGIDEKGQIRSEKTHKFKDSLLGKMPEEWGICKLFDLLTQIIDFRGKTPKKIGMDWGNGDIPALSANNVEIGRINLEKETYYGSKELYKKWMNKGDCEKGDVIMTMEAPLGNVAQIPDDKRYILSQRVVLLKTSPLVDKTFFRYLLMSSYFQSKLVADSTGSTATGIQQKKLIKIFTTIPPKPEQLCTARILSQADYVLEIEEIYKQKLLALKRGLMEDLLSGKVRVNSLIKKNA